MEFIKWKASREAGSPQRQGSRRVTSRQICGDLDNPTVETAVALDCENASKQEEGVIYSCESSREGAWSVSTLCSFFFGSIHHLHSQREWSNHHQYEPANVKINNALSLDAQAEPALSRMPWPQCQSPLFRKGKSVSSGKIQGDVFKPFRSRTPEPLNMCSTEHG